MGGRVGTFNLTNVQSENLDEFIRGLSPDELDSLELAMQVELARGWDDVDGFESF